MSGEALKLQQAIATLQKRHHLRAPPFTPLAPFPSIRHDVVRQGLCSPATVDREHTKFAATCWRPFKQDIPILYRHDPDQPAGRLEELRADVKGLFARVRLSHDLAKQAPYFSVCATIHDWRIVEAGAQSHGLIIDASLNEISMVPNSPGNVQALALRPCAAVEFFDLVGMGVEKALEIIETIQRICAQTEPQVASRTMTCERPQLLRCSAPRIYGPVPRRPSPPRTEFGRLADALSQMEA